MGVPSKEFKAALGIYFSLAAVATDDESGEITAVTVEIDGIHRAKIRTSRPEKYRLFIDVHNIRSELPTVWVLDPPNERVGHVNIFEPTRCHALGKDLPRLCWGSYVEQWRNAPAQQRTLLALLQNIQQYLSHPNYSSPAR